MKHFTRDIKSTIWVREHIYVDAETDKEAAEKILSEGLEGDFEYLYDTIETGIEPENGRATEYIQNEEGSDVWDNVNNFYEEK